jgi:hydroxymethylbilane synthase
LPEGAIVGTGSVRRTSQLAIVRPDLKFKPLVGNVDTRMRKLIEGEYDAIILAVAGLKRLGVLAAWSESEYRDLVVRPLEASRMVPAPGQAVLVLEAREGEGELVEFLNDPDTEACATAERAFLRTFGGGCSVPVAALAEVNDGKLMLRGLVASPDGRTVFEGDSEGDDPSTLGQELANRLGEQGAFRTVQAVVAARPGGLG